MRHTDLGNLVRHVRITAECFAIDPARQTLKSGQYYQEETAVTNGRGDTFTVQMPYSKKKGTDEQLAHTRRYLEWLESRAEAEDMDETTILSSEEPFVDRLAAILTWGGRGSLTTLELDARFIEGLNQMDEGGERSGLEAGA